MKRTLVATMVLGLLATAAPAVITHTITYEGSYTVGIGTGPLVDVYKINFAVVDASNPGLKLGSLVFEIGANAGDPSFAQGVPHDPNDPNVYNNPFQGAYRTGGKVPVTNLTPTRDQAIALLSPPDASKLYETDSSFLPPGILTWAPSVVTPAEVNDASVYGLFNDDYVAGVGNLRVSVAIPNLNRAPSIDAVMVGAIRGTTVYLYTGSADELGRTTKERFLVNAVIPEPATLSVLAMGLLGLLGRRRRT